MDIRIERLKRRLTQYDLSKNTGIHQCRISLIENGYIKPSDDELDKIADFFMVIPEECLSNF